VYCAGWPPVPALYNAPVFAVSAVNVMAAQSVSIDKYPKGEQQVGEERPGACTKVNELFST